MRVDLSCILEAGLTGPGDRVDEGIVMTKGTKVLFSAIRWQCYLLR